MIDIIGLISSAHNNQREKIALGVEYSSMFGPTYEKSNVTTVNFNKVIKYLSENLLVHFKQEEILIDLIEENVDTTAEEQRVMSKILRKHKELRIGFKKLNEVISRDDLDYEMIREFSEKSRRLLNDLFQHAREEDETFYPFVREKLTTENLLLLEARIKK
ncbi:MAG: hemerythrin domain-containing protein [Candidatus Thermoplasmatota archaeon]|nr:hemerythrin domain-containing protein [Candidatus Thermoplasmatota archaeon]MDP7264959.1 hemerythrin domain-containing protein [Candidatus Thermoplasmatota archaeon]